MKPVQSEHKAASADSELQLREALELYLEQLEEGAALETGEFVSRYPEIADELQKHLAGLNFIHLAGSKLVTTESTKSIPNNVKELGDFQLIQEIGRGGLGSSMRRYSFRSVVI